MRDEFYAILCRHPTSKGQNGVGAYGQSIGEAYADFIVQ